MNGRNFQAMTAASLTATIASVEFTFSNWGSLNLLKKIIKILFIWMGVVEIAFSLVMFILGMIGTIISYIPIVNIVYNIVVYVVFVLGVVLGLIGNIYAPKGYLEYINNAYKSGLMKARQYNL